MQVSHIVSNDPQELERLVNARLRELMGGGERSLHIVPSIEYAACGGQYSALIVYYPR
jgi:hypothetical protein